VVLVIKHSLPLGASYLYSPRGPVFKLVSKQTPSRQPGGLILDELLLQVQKTAKAAKSIFWRIDPPRWLSLGFWQPAFKTVKSWSFQPEQELILPLKKDSQLISLEQLLASMKPKTRYNIRLAGRKGIKVRWSSSQTLAGDWQIFYELLQQTAKRNNFKLHPAEHYRNILKILGAGNLANLIIARYQNQTVAANLITFLGDTAYYLHGGSVYKNRSLMAPYLLHWQTILEARRRGLKYYNLGGVSLHSNKQTAWAGLTKFKLGFGGQVIKYPATFDLVFDKTSYGLYRLARWARR